VRLNNIAKAQGRMPVNFRVYFTVPTKGTWGERRALLQGQYLGAPESAGGSPTTRGAMFSFVAQIWLAALHQQAKERRAAERAASTCRAGGRLSAGNSRRRARAMCASSAGTTSIPTTSTNAGRLSQ